MSTAALMTTDSRQILLAHPCDNYCETLILHGVKLGYVVRRCQSCSALKRLAKQLHVEGAEPFPDVGAHGGIREQALARGA